ncbi:MAG: AAA family ATPase [Candidatus Heimdallarchaeota archaeon]|nr:AAA family ATPase [Candidatus Heimdallarchaeota archaeon]
MTGKDFTIKSVNTNRDFISSGKITHVYGPPKSGKSTLSANIALELVKLGYKIMIISTERPIEIRMHSIIEATETYTKELLSGIITSDIYTFDDLIEVITKELIKYIAEVDLIIIDSITASYRFKAGPINLTLLRKALSVLQSIALNQRKAIMFTNQVSSVMDDSNNFRPVASASTRNYSDVTIRLTKRRDNSTEISFEDDAGNELEVFEPFIITEAGIEEFSQLFLIEP